jgi:hypothetical protein
MLDLSWSMFTANSMINQSHWIREEPLHRYGCLMSFEELISRSNYIETHEPL